MIFYKTEWSEHTGQYRCVWSGSKREANKHAAEMRRNHRKSNIVPPEANIKLIKCERSKRGIVRFLNVYATSK